MSNNVTFTAFIALLASISFAHASDKASTEGEIARAYAEFSLSQGNTRAAEEELDRHLKRFPKDAETRGAWAALQEKQGKLEAASQGYEQAAQASPSATPRARWMRKQADVLDKMGQKPRALSLRQEATSILSTGSPSAPSESKLGVTASARSGYDTNVLLIPNDTLSAQAISGQSGVLLGADAVLSGSRKLGDNGLQYLGGTAINWYTGEKTAQFSSVSASAGTRYERQTLGTFSLDSGVILLNRSGLGYYNFSATLGWERQVSELSIGKLYAGARFRWQDFADPASGPVPAQDRDGPVVAARGRLETRLPKGQALVSSLEIERALTSGKDFQSLAFGAQSSWSMPISLRDRLMTGLRVFRTNYISNPLNRADWAFLVAPGWSRKLRPDSQLSLNYLFNVNQSNLKDASYSKHVILLQATHEIL